MLVFAVCMVVGVFGREDGGERERRMGGDGAGVGREDGGERDGRRVGGLVHASRRHVGR